MNRKKQLELLNAAKSALKFAYAPYSKFRVGAALVSSTGKIYCGCNVENGSYGLTICAERNAIAKAVSEGEKKITAIAVVAEKGGRIFPCGACLQVISEFGKEALILTADSKGKIISKKIKQLMPEGFNFKRR